jgi:hypothetical protein
MMGRNKNIRSGLGNGRRKWSREVHHPFHLCRAELQFCVFMPYKEL